MIQEFKEFIQPQECTKVFDLGDVKDAFSESRAGVPGFGEVHRTNAPNRVLCA